MCAFKAVIFSSDIGILVVASPTRILNVFVVHGMTQAIRDAHALDKMAVYNDFLAPLHLPDCPPPPGVPQSAHAYYRQHGQRIQLVLQSRAAAANAMLPDIKGMRFFIQAWYSENKG